MTAKMCTPCERQFAEYLRERGKTLKAQTIVPTRSRTKDEKVTCIVCGRKHFGGEFDFDGRLHKGFRRTVKK